MKFVEKTKEVVKNNKKVIRNIAIGAGVVAAGVGGYFLYKKFGTKPEVVLPEVTLGDYDSVADTGF